MKKIVSSCLLLSSLFLATSASAGSSESTHTVKKGDTLWGISKTYHTTVSELQVWNQLPSTLLKIGQVLNVKSKSTTLPAASGKIHTVAKGDTLWGISRKYKVTVSDLMKWNKLSSPVIKIGQKLIVSQGSASKPPAETPKPTAPPKQQDTVKGIFISGNAAGLDSKFNSLVGLVDRTELNAVVIDVKGDVGNITYDSNIALANSLGTDHNPLIKNISQRMSVLDDKNIYTIARIVTFKDPLVAKKRTDLAMKRKDGSLYYDSGIPWVDPYKKSYWEYVIGIAKEAASKGFDEIQFDYVRFPTNGKYVDQVVKFDNPKGISKAENIKNFLEYAKKELSPYGVKVSADIFGIATSDKTDSGIGHHWETLTQATDVMSPMMYPSHYAKGAYGISNPDGNPYMTIKIGLGHAVTRNQALVNQGKKVAEIRPWFQDFTDKRVSGYTIYGTKQVKDQIRAAEEYGIHSYLLWNPQNVYTESALK